MPSTLRDNLTSSYFHAAHKLYPKKTRRRIIAYVESYDDIAFWRSLLEEFENDEYYFQVMLPSSTSLTKDRKSTRLNSSHANISYAVFCLKKKNNNHRLMTHV